MHQYRQIVIQLRSGGTLRGIARSKIADRKTVRRIRDIANQHGWLDPKCEMPDDSMLAKFLGTPKIKVRVITTFLRKCNIRKILIPHKACRA